MGSVPNPTDKRINPTVTVRFNQEMTLAQAAALHAALAKILGDTPKTTNSPVAVTPIRKARRTATGHPVSTAGEYQIRWQRNGGRPCRRTYQTINGALAAVDRLEDITRGQLDGVQIVARKVGAWEPYDGTPRSGYEYRIGLRHPDWSSTSTLIRGANGLVAKIKQNAGSDIALTIDQREVLGDWAPIDLEAVA